MTASQDDTLTATLQEQTEETRMGQPIDVQLTATESGGTITVSGNGAADLPKNSGATRFNFILDDQTNFNVQFASVDTADNSTACPPPTGENSQQITAVYIENDKSPRTAHFTDNNSNQASNGPMNVSYAWNFTCDPGATVKQFDPIITNRGTGPII